MSPIKEAIEALEAADAVCERIITQDGGILGGVDFHAHRKGTRAALAALRSMPAEPVAWMYRPTVGSDQTWKFTTVPPWDWGTNLAIEDRPLYLAATPYTAPLSDAWQPIETAPKRGPILIIDMTARMPQAACGCYPCEKASGGTAVGDWYVTSNISMRPTHWQPLPPPPIERAVFGRGGEQ